MIVEKIQKCLKYLQEVQINEKPNPRTVTANSPEHFALQHLADIQTLIKRNFAEQGYWIFEGETYPNAAELYTLGQRATDNRNEQTKKDLEKQLIKESTIKQKKFIYLSELK